MHINFLEMLAFQNCLQAMAPQLRRKHVVIAGDNTTCLAYIKKPRRNSLDYSFSQSGGNSDMGVSESDLPINSIRTRSPECPGRRNQILPTEWSSAQEALLKVWFRWGKPQIDLFTTRLNHKLLIFVAPVKDPLAWKIDAFAMNWENLHCYAYPQSTLFREHLQKSCKKIAR